MEAPDDSTGSDARCDLPTPTPTPRLEDASSSTCSTTNIAADEALVDIEKAPKSPAVTLMDWTGPNDPCNPQNWSSWQKAYHMSVPMFLGFVVSIGTSIYTPAVDSVAKQFHVSDEVSLLGFTFYVLGMACGPLLGSPISETWGRRAVYLVSIPIFALFTMAAGLAQNTETVIICRLFAGLFGGPVIAVGAGTNADLYTADLRAVTTAFYCMAPFFATGMSPVMGSYATAGKTWRWTEWILIFFTIFFYIVSMFTKETYKKTILRNRNKKQGLSVPPNPPFIPLIKTIMTIVLFRPIHMLFTEPIVGFFSIYVGFNFAVLFGFLPSIPVVFSSVYGFTPQQTGLPFLAICVGVVLSVITSILLDQYSYLPRLRANRARGGTGIVMPEYRLYGAMLGSIGLPVALFWYGWSARPNVHWIVPIIGLVPFAWGNLTVFISLTLFTVDTYQAANGASAMAANGLLRYITGATFPLFTVQMYQRLGPGWASSLLGFITVALLPVPWIFFKWGKYYRSKSGYDIVKS